MKARRKGSKYNEEEEKKTWHPWKDTDECYISDLQFCYLPTRKSSFRVSTRSAFIWPIVAQLEMERPIVIHFLLDHDYLSTRIDTKWFVSVKFKKIIWFIQDICLHQVHWIIVNLNDWNHGNYNRWYCMSKK